LDEIHHCEAKGLPQERWIVKEVMKHFMSPWDKKLKDIMVYTYVDGYKQEEIGHDNGYINLFLGAGIGMEYSFHNYESTENTVSPKVVLHGGFVTPIGKNESLQVRFSVEVVFIERIICQVGFDLSFVWRLHKWTLVRLKNIVYTFMSMHIELNI
jgi:hypothetical protein